MSTPLKGAIICKSRYGATRQYAEWLGDRLDLPIFDPDTDRPQLKSFDYLLIGSSVYMGKMLIRNWLVKHKDELDTKKIFFFVVCATPASEKEKQEKIATDNIPAELMDEQSVLFLPGRLIIDKLSWMDRWILRLGARLEKDPQKKATMHHDMDGMDRRYLEPLIDSVNALITSQPQHRVPA